MTRSPPTKLAGVTLMEQVGNRSYTSIYLKWLTPQNQLFHTSCYDEE